VFGARVRLPLLAGNVAGEGSIPGPAGDTTPSGLWEQETAGVPSF